MAYDRDTINSILDSKKLIEDAWEQAYVKNLDITQELDEAKELLDKALAKLGYQQED